MGVRDERHPRPQKEPALSAVRSILHLLAKAPKEYESLLTFDLFTKYHDLQNRHSRYELLGAYLKLSHSISNISMETILKEEEGAVRKSDIGIITIKRPELMAAKIAFNISADTPPTFEAEGFRFWETQIPTSSTTLSVMITMIGEAGNVRVA